MCLCFIILTIGVAVSADECEGDRQAMIKECAKYQQWPANPKLDPSDACCAVWQKANIPCLCAGVTKEKEKIYCMEKVGYVANFCKKPFPHGYKCGSKWNILRELRWSSFHTCSFDICYSSDTHDFDFSDAFYMLLVLFWSYVGSNWMVLQVTHSLLWRSDSSLVVGGEAWLLHSMCLASQ